MLNFLVCDVFFKEKRGGGKTGDEESGIVGLDGRLGGCEGGATMGMWNSGFKASLRSRRYRWNNLWMRNKASVSSCVAWGWARSRRPRSLGGARRGERCKNPGWRTVGAGAKMSHK